MTLIKKLLEYADDWSIGMPSKVRTKLEEAAIKISQLSAFREGVRCGDIVCCCPLNSLTTSPNCPLHGANQP